MRKSIKWSSLAEDDLTKILDYLEIRWNKNVCTKFINKLDFCIDLIRKNPKQFPFINKDFQIRKCIITKQNTLYYRETNSRIEVLRLYDTRQNPDSLQL
ncbi:type II toxin-antitoxin system RelE/ParE family toxin [Flavobacterium frigoris]|uniref:type II toxin-antitoxin system RelE/ParE family toxin n=1 Tax=Flavobacterium frigoris TaxID=229204 RepID=UPI000943EB02|nr:type II toxin-antitoxin system RelE/ParE family toxin [Flavobacterium frigoris]